MAYERFGVHLSAAENEPDDFRLTVNNMRKYVFSRSVKHVPGNGMMVNGDIRETVKRITEEEGKDIWLCGGADIINTFANMGLIDEYLLAIQPTILGSGKPLFGHLDHRIQLELLHAERLNSGVVLLNYKPLCKGAFRIITHNGSFFVQ
jgi:dihydrofolate reductase